MASLQNSVPVQATVPRQKVGGLDVEADVAQLVNELGGFGIGYVDENEVLRDGGAELTAAEALGELGDGFKLLAGEAARGARLRRRS